MTSNVLSFFWHLASSSKDTRLNASADLVSSLQTFQRSYIEAKDGESSSDEDDDEDEDEESDDESGVEVDGSDDEEVNSAEARRLEKALGKNNAEDVVYSVKRLLRGLASSRESSRLGFAVALTELLNRIDTVSAGQVLPLLIRASPFSPTSKGADARDALFARLFGLNAIVQSKSLFRNTSTVAVFERVIDELIKLGSVKGWLRESAWWAIVSATEGLLDSEVEWKDEGVQALLEKVYEEKEWSQEKIALTLVLEQRRPDLRWKDLISPTFKHTPLLHSSNLVTIGKLLKESDVEDEEEGLATSSTGSWKPQLHFVWNIILDIYFPQTSTTTTDNSRAPFQDFFRVIVDESLFSNSSSSERKYWGFSVLSRSLPIVPAAQLPLLFTPNVMRCWINNLSSSDRYLHKAALNLAKQVQDAVKTSPTVGFTLLSTLVGKNGRTDFDKATKTKTVEGILGSLSKEGVSEYIAYLQRIVLGEEKNGSDVAGLEERRVWALDQILGLFRNGKVPKEDSTIASVLEFLVLHAFFVIRKTDKKSSISALHTAPKPALSETTAAACRAKLFSALVEVTTASPAKDSNRQQGCDASGNLWIRKALDVLTSLESNSKHVELMLDADEEIRRPRSEALATLAALDSAKAKADQTEIKRGVEILLAFTVLQTYDESDDALEHLEEVNAAAQRMFGLSTSKDSSSSEEDVEPIDSLLDVLIAFLDKSSANLRNLANLVVGMVAPAFTVSSIEHLVAQLQQTAAETIEVDEEAQEEDEGSGQEDAEADAASDDDEESVSSVSEGEEDDEEEEEEDVAVDPAFRQRVADALKAAGMGVDEDVEEDSDEEEDGGDIWDDEQMEKVDEQLAEVFRQRANAGKSSDFKHLHIESIHFKNRILDFFDAFAQKQSSNPVVLHIIVPLLRLIQSTNTTEADLSNKTSSIIKSRLGKARTVPTNADVEFAQKILVEIHELARRAATADFSGLCNVASLFVVRTLDASSFSTTSSIIVDTYRATLQDYMNRKSSQVHPPFIIDLLRRFPVRAFPLAKDLIHHADPSGGAKKVYRQLQAFTMLQVISQQLGTIAKSVEKKDLEAFIRQAEAVVFKTLESAAKGEVDGWNAARLKEVAKFGLHLARSSKNVLGQEAESLLDVKRLEEVISSVKAGEKTGEMKGLVDLLGQIQNVWKAKEAKTEKGKGKGKAKQVKQNGDADAMDIDEPVVNGTEKTEKAAKAEKVKGKKRDVNGDAKITTVDGEKVKAKKRKEADGKTEVKRKKVKATTAA